MLLLCCSSMADEVKLYTYEEMDKTVVDAIREVAESDAKLAGKYADSYIHGDYLLFIRDTVDAINIAILEGQKKDSEAMRIKTQKALRLKMATPEQLKMLKENPLVLR